MLRSKMVWLTLLLGFLATSVWGQDTAKRSISNVGGGLYRFQNNFHYSVFLVTEQGVLVTDPINADAARWLKAEIAKRFKQPIRYLVYSHDHADHSSGGEVFAEAGAIVVAHANAKSIIKGEKRPTAIPEITFERQLTLELGGQQVILNYHGKNHSNNMITMLFPAQRALFAVDFIPVKTVAYKTLTDSWFPEWPHSLEQVEHLDFDILIPGHGAIGSKADVSVFRNYLQDLYSEVLEQVRSGKTLEQIKVAVDLSKYKTMEKFNDWAPMNVEGVYKQIQLHRRGN